MSPREEFGDTSNKSKIILAILLIVIIAGAWYYFYYMDTSTKINNLQSSIEKLSKFKRELPILRIKYKKAQKEFAIYKKELPLKGEIPSLLVQLTDIIKSKDVSLMSFQPKQAVDKKIYYVKPIDISIVATYRNCGAVFEDVSKMKRLFKVKNFSLSNPKIVNSKKVLLKIKFSAETYYFKQSKKKKR